MRQTSFFELDINDKVISMFSVCTDVSHINPNNYIGWRIDGYNNSNFDLSHMFNNMFDKKTEDFSKKEVQIIKELSLGLQSKEIGEKLLLVSIQLIRIVEIFLKKLG